MFEYLRNIEGNSNPVMMFLKATTVENDQPKKGDAVAISAGLAVKAGSNSTQIMGIAKENVGENGEVLVIVDPHATYRVDFTGSSKQTIGQSDVFTSFDLANENTLDLDATTNGQFMILEFDNNNHKAVVKINKPIL